MDEETNVSEEVMQTSEGETSEENTQQDSQPTQETTGEALEDEPAGETEGAETEGEPRKGAQSRIKELNTRAKQAEEYAQGLEARIAELTGQVDQSAQAPYIPQYQPGQEISPEQLQQDVMRQADSIVTLRIKQAEATNRIRNESLDVVRKYPQLDPSSESFDPELSESVTEAIEAQVRMNPYSASVTKLAEKMMRPYTRAVTKEVGKVSENIAKQVSQSALRPTSVRKEEKNASEKSIAELEQELGIVQH